MKASALGCVENLTYIRLPEKPLWEVPDESVQHHRSAAPLRGTALRGIRETGEPMIRERGLYGTPNPF